MDRPRSRPLSPVYEEEGNGEEKERKVRGGPRNEPKEGEIEEISSFPESDTESDGEDALPIEVDVHGVKAKVYLNCAEADIIPARYLEKADRLHILKRVPWIFRAAKDGRTVNINKWSKVDIRYRGVFKTLKKVPPFEAGLFDVYTLTSVPTSTLAPVPGEGAGAGCKGTGAGSGHGRFRSGSGSSSRSSRFDFEEAVKAQGQVVYALLDEVFNMLKITREADDHRVVFFLRPRLLTCQPEYWVGYRAKHRDTPLTAGSVSLDFEPSRGTPRAVMPVVTTAERNQPLKQALEGEIKLLLAQLLVHIHRLSPPGDKIPDQEAFLIAMHGSKLHILRGIFPGQKTSKLWCGRHIPGNRFDGDAWSTSTPNLFSRMSMSSSSSSSSSTIDEDRDRAHEPKFYSKTNLERFMEQVEWSQLSDPSNEAHPRAFQVLGSREYDLWLKWEFAGALRMLSGLAMYLMSGQARCGVLQDVFERYPYDEGFETESDDGSEGKENVMREQREVEEEEGRARVSEREAMRSLVRDKIGGFAEGLKQPWWDWDWDDKDKSEKKKGGCGKDEELIMGGP
ncbi:uncharacterized protein BDV17DRAFT_287845 [Aspergillus undulatus]|uniref:uncharacterized protein n=1 Tax=Aspergillus undulatus TaxID=1810928 RepID=UPI003CCD073F